MFASLRGRSIALAVACLAAVIPAASWASVACIPSQNYLGAGGAVTHPNLNSGASLWAGTIKAFIDGQGNAVELYCVDLNHHLCRPECYEQSEDVAATEIVWILNNYYPMVASEPASLDHEAKRARAVQLAIWHFSDGLDIATDGIPDPVFEAARAIVAAAMTQAVPKTPTSLALSPASSSGAPPGTHTVTATVRDQNGNLMPDISVHFAVTGTHAASGDVMTNASGEASFSYNGTQHGDDQILATVDYTIPIGLRWTHGGCQRLIMGKSSPGRIRRAVKRSWDGQVHVQEESWGRVKTLYRD